MKSNQIVEMLKTCKGQCLNIRLKSAVPTLAAHKNVAVTKVTEMTVLAGIAFENRKDVKDSIAAGERGAVGFLPWGVWAEFPFSIEHKGQDYIRFYLPSKAQIEAGFARETTVNFFTSGECITRERAIELCGSKAQARDNEQGCMTVKAEGVEFI